MYVTLLMLVMFIVPIPIIVGRMKRQKPPYQTILDGIIGVALGSVFLFILSSVSGQPLSETLMSTFDTFSDFMLNNGKLMNSLGMADFSPEEKKEFVKVLFTTAVEGLPAVILMYATIISYFEYMFIAKMINYNGVKVPVLEKIKHFTLPRNAITGFVIIFVLSWLVTVIGLIHGNMLTMNVNMLFEFAFALQGMAVIFYFGDTKNYPKFVSIVIAFIFMCNGLGRLVLFVVGVIDLVIGLREKISRKIQIRR